MSIEEMRMIERLVIAGGGVLAIWLGFQLFQISNIKPDSSGKLKAAIVEVSLTKVGPGVFFALFGRLDPCNRPDLNHSAGAVAYGC